MLDLDSDILLRLNDISILPESAGEIVSRTGRTLAPELSSSVLITAAYANETQVSGVRPIHFWLKWLEGFGKEILELALVTELIQNRGIADSGKLSSRVAAAKTTIFRAIANDLNLADLLQLSKGQNQANELIGLTDIAARKLLGAICLSGDLQIVRDFISPYIDTALSPHLAKPFDSKTLLQEVSQSKKLGIPKYEVLSRTGPDHDLQFSSRVLVGRLEGVGVGRSKKQSEQEAAWQLLKRLNVSAAEETTGASGYFDFSKYCTPNYQRTTIVSVQKRLQFEFVDQRFLSLALVHPSYVHESRGTIQCSNRPLATLGSKVLRALVMLLVIKHPERWWSRTVDNYTRGLSMIAGAGFLVPLGRRLGLPDILLVGRGQASTLSNSLGMEAVQACVGAMFLDVGASVRHDRLHKSFVIKELAEHLEQLSGFDAMIDADPITILQEVAQAIGISLSYDTVSVIGPEQASNYVVELIISGRGESFRFRSEPCTNKTMAKAGASNLPLRVISGISKGLEGLSAIINLQSSSEQGFARFLISRFMETLKAGPATWIVFSNLHIFGANEIVLGSRDQVRCTLEHLLELLAVIAPGYIEELGLLIRRHAVRPRPEVQEHLRRVAERVAIFLDSFLLENASPLQNSSEFRDLLAVSALGARIQSMIPRELTGKELESTFRTVRGWRVSYTPGFEAAASIYGDLGHLLELIAVLARELNANENGEDLRLSFDRVGSFITFVLTGGKDSCQLMNERMLLINVLASPAIVRQSDQQILIEYPRMLDDKIQFNEWVEHSIRAVFDSASQTDQWLRPFAAAAHDLKNLFLAIDGQLANAILNPSRRYQYLAAAEQTLFTARASARNLSVLLQRLPIADYNRFSFSNLLKQFVADLYRRVPQGITLQAMQDASVVDIVGDEFLIHAALENLSKNAIEALGSSGVLKIEWLFDPTLNSVLVEVADNGPGIPDAVIAAFSEGRPAPSGKPQGCGWGLLSVQHIARIHGGELTVHRTNPGTVFTLILPAWRKEECSDMQPVVEEWLEKKEGGE